MKIPLKSIKVGTRVKIIKGDGVFPNGTVQFFGREPDHYSNKYPDLPCFRINDSRMFCSIEYILLPKLTIII